MAEGKRPGGLTALAVINFVLCGFSVLSIVGMMAFFALQDMGMPTLVLIIGLNLLSGLLLLTSGIGYLKQKRVLGRMLGNTYAVLTIVASIVSGMMFRTELGGGFNIGTIIGLIYPILTLVLVNTTFKDDLTN